MAKRRRRWAAMLPTGLILDETFAHTKAEARELAEHDHLPEGAYRLIRVRLVPADPPVRERGRHAP